MPKENIHVKLVVLMMHTSLMPILIVSYGLQYLDSMWICPHTCIHEY